MNSHPPHPLSPMQAGKMAIFKRHSEAFATFGFAISQFSGIEQALLAVFVYLDDRSAEQSIRAYWQISSCRGRYDWIAKRVKNSSCPSEICRSWSAISSRVDDALETRNQLAHGEFTPISISHTDQIVGFWANIAKNASTGKLTFNTATRMIDGCPFFSPDDLVRTGLEFIDLSQDLFAMVNRQKAARNSNVTP